MSSAPSRQSADQTTAVNDNAEQNDDKGQKKRRIDQSNTRSGKREKQVFPYGNYPNYYGYRNDLGEADVRLAHLKRSWFCSKSCLDIGCNSGKLTMEIAKKFAPASIVGVEIDPSLVQKANHFLNLRKEFYNKIAAEKGLELPADIPKDFPISFRIKFGPLIQRFPDNVSFRAGNALDQQFDERYDTITWYVFNKEVFTVVVSVDVTFLSSGNEHVTDNLVFSFSTTKWIHLNWGDEGIKKFFKKVSDSLKEGGLFLLEPQEWKSYKKKHGLTPTIKDNWKKIKLLPSKFSEYLTTELDFELIRTIQITDATFAGFERPMYLFVKVTKSNKNEKMDVSDGKQTESANAPLIEKS